MEPIYHGWTPTLPKIEQLENWRKACLRELEQNSDGNRIYWENSLAEAERQIDAWFESEYAEEIAQAKDWREQMRDERP